MGVQDDLTDVHGQRTSREAIMAFWSAAEYAARTVQEQRAVMEAAKAAVDLPNCPASIKANGQGVLDKFQVLLDGLADDHAAFLTWTPPE